MPGMEASATSPRGTPSPSARHGRALDCADRSHICGPREAGSRPAIPASCILAVFRHEAVIRVRFHGTATAVIVCRAAPDSGQPNRSPGPGSRPARAQEPGAAAIADSFSARAAAYDYWYWCCGDSIENGANASGPAGRSVARASAPIRRRHPSRALLLVRGFLLLAVSFDDLLGDMLRHVLIAIQRRRKGASPAGDRAQLRGVAE